jgi:type I restriction enzyme, S subunit
MTSVPEVALAQIGRIITGRTPPSEVDGYFGSGCPFVTPTDMDGRKYIRTTERELSKEGRSLLARCVVPAASVMVSCIGWQMGKAALTDRESVTNQQLNTIVPNEGVSAEYVYYALCIRRDELKRLGSVGTRTPIVNKSVFSAMRIPLPAPYVQRSIARILSAYDDLIENCERRIRILDEMVRALYREWFVLLRYPGHEKVPLVDSSLGRIPRGWEVQRFDEIVRVHRGRSYRTPDLADAGGVPFVNLKCINRDGGFRRSGIKRFVGVAPESHAVRSGDIVVAVTDMTQERRIVARAAIVPTLDTDFGALSMDLVRLEPLAPLAAPWVYAYLRYSSFADHVKQHANGANVLHLSPDRIREHVLAAPPPSLVASFSGRIASQIEMCDVLENRTENLRRTRDLLLPRLLSGHLDVGDEA